MQVFLNPRKLVPTNINESTVIDIHVRIEVFIISNFVNNEADDVQSLQIGNLVENV